MKNLTMQGIRCSTACHANDDRSDELERIDLGRHLRSCRLAQGRLFAWQSGWVKAMAFISGRRVTGGVVLLLIALAYSVLR